METVLEAVKSYAGLHFACYVLGAAFVSFAETAALFAIVVVPLLPTYGVHRSVSWAQHLLAPRKRDESFRRALLVPLLGAWLGAFASPLDWGMWWQQWPIASCAMAAATGVPALIVRLVCACIEWS